MIEEEVRFCIRCGTPTERRKRFGKVRPVCAACGWVFFPDPKVAVAAIVCDERGQILLVRRANDPQRGLWTMPGGFMDAGEDPRQAAERECLEETGLQVRVDGLLDFVSRPASSMGAHLILYFCASVLTGTLQAGDDAEKTAFFSQEQIPPLAFETETQIRRLAALCAARSEQP